MIDPIDLGVESALEMRDRVIEGSEYLPVDRLGTCGGCGFTPFADGTSTSRETAFGKVAACVEGTTLEPAALGFDFRLNPRVRNGQTRLPAAALFRLYETLVCD